MLFMIQLMDNENQRSQIEWLGNFSSYSSYILVNEQVVTIFIVFFKHD